MNCAMPAFAQKEIPKRSLPEAHTIKEIEGWRVRVDDRLLNGDNAALGTRALKVIEAKLVNITLLWSGSIKPDC